MLSKPNRLKKNVQFNYIYKKGSKSFSKHLTLVFVKSKINAPKLGFSISKKIGNAVVRNLVKRRLRANITLLLPFLATGHNYVIVAKQGINECDFWELNKQLLALFTKAGLYENNNANS